MTGRGKQYMGGARLANYISFKVQWRSRPCCPDTSEAGLRSNGGEFFMLHISSIQYAPSLPGQL